jgi:hypothetical protein
MAKVTYLPVFLHLWLINSFDKLYKMNQTLSLEKRLDAFAGLGKILGRAGQSFGLQDKNFMIEYPDFHDAWQKTSLYNPWFTPENINFALNAWNEVLTHESIEKWISKYKSDIQNTDCRKVAVIMAGNIPMVGFHDFMCVLIAGHNFLGKLSSDDKILLPAIARELCRIEPAFTQFIEFTESTIHDFDAIIATGSNNTARYFEYYFSKYPHIIRKNRNGVAVLTGSESEETLKKLGIDICTYFRLGCRNVSKVFVPIGYDIKKLFAAIEPHVKSLSDHYKYMNNHSYHRSIFLLNNTPHLDNDVFLLTESEQYSSPIPVIYYQFYENIETLKNKLLFDDELIQCIANNAFTAEKSVPIGDTQLPGLADYADGIDTMNFLISL